MPSNSDNRPTRTVSLDIGQANGLKRLALELSEQRGKPVTVRDLVRDAVARLLKEHNIIVAETATKEAEPPKKRGPRPKNG